MPEVQAHLADGTILTFPEGTPDEVVQKTVKAQLSKDSTVNALRGKKPSSTGYGFEEAGGTAGEIVNAARPFSIPAALRVGTSVASDFPGPPALKAGAGAVAAGGTYFGMDAALQKVRNLLQGKEDAPDVGDSALNLGINELGTRAIGGLVRGAAVAKGPVGRGVKSALDFLGVKSSQPLTPGQEEMSKLSPTFAQYFGNRPIPKGLEDLFAGKTKTESIKQSGKLADELLTKKAQGVSRRSASVVNNPEELGGRIQVNDLSNALNSTFVEADKQANIAKLIAKGNSISIPGKLQNAPEVEQIAKSTTGKPFSNLNQNEQATVLKIAQQMGVQPPVNPPIEGPTQLSSTLEASNKFYKAIQGLILEVPEEQKAIVNRAYQLLKRTNAQFDPQTGKLIASDPVSFQESWDLAQELNSNAGWGKSRNDLTQSERGFRQLSKQVTDDIEASIAKWPNGAKQAQQAWYNSKAAVAQRNALFYPEGSNNKLGNIIEDVDSPVSAIDSILGDPKQLQRALNSGSIKFRSGTVASNNMRGDLQAYNLIKLRDNAKKLDAVDQAGGLTFDGQKMYNDWLDPRSPRNNTTLYSNQQKQDYDQLFKNIAMTQQKGSTLGSYLSKVYLTKGLLSIAPVLVGVANHSLSTGAHVALVELGAMGVAKLMAKPEYARILVAAAGGNPLSMSEQLAARKLTAGLQGVTLALTGTDGSREEGSFDRDGTFKPDEPK